MLGVLLLAALLEAGGLVPAALQGGPYPSLDVLPPLHTLIPFYLTNLCTPFYATSQNCEAGLGGEEARSMADMRDLGLAFHLL